MIARQPKKEHKHGLLKVVVEFLTLRWLFKTLTGSNNKNK
jgi:hypothetical protein